MPSAPLTATSNYTSQRLLALALCFALGTNLSCAQANGQNYFPLIDGAKWKYTGRFLSANGGQYPIHSTIHIDGVTLIHGRRYYKYVISGDFTGVPNMPPQIEQVRYYRAESSGIYFLPGNELDGAEKLSMPLPMPIDERWLSGTAEVTAERDGTIEAGGHRYTDCIKLTYKEPDGRRSTEDYYAPGIGLVKSVYTNTTPPQSTVELILESYHL